MAVSHINSNDSLNTGRIKVNQTIDNIKRSLVYYSLPYNTEIPDYEWLTKADREKQPKPTDLYTHPDIEAELGNKAEESRNDRARFSTFKAPRRQDR